MRTFVSLTLGAVLATWLAVPALVSADDEVEHRSTYKSETTVDSAPARIKSEGEIVAPGSGAVARERRSSETTVKSGDDENDNTEVESKTTVKHDD